MHIYNIYVKSKDTTPETLRCYSTPFKEMSKVIKDITIRRWLNKTGCRIEGRGDYRVTYLTTPAQEQNRKLLIDCHVSVQSVCTQINGTFSNPKTLHTRCLYRSIQYFQMLKSVNNLIRRTSVIHCAHAKL